MYNIHKKEPTRVFFTQPVLLIYLNFITRFGIIILMSSLYLVFVKERPRPATVFSFMFTIRLPDDGQSNRPKHV